MVATTMLVTKRVHTWIVAVLAILAHHALGTSIGVVAAGRPPSIDSLTIVAGFVMAVLPQFVDAHNWMNNPPSRTPGLTKETPCPQRNGNAVHIAVKPGDDFWLEYATGHRRHTYVTVVKAQDEDLLRRVSADLLDRYLSGDSEYLSGGKYRKHHVRAHSCTSQNCRGVSNERASTGPGTKHTREIDPSEIGFSRPSSWRCARVPPARSGCTGVQYSYYEYEDGQMGEDRTRAYTNAEMPWIVASGKYKMVQNRPKDHDLVAFRMPPGAEPGAYVVQYYWNGYRDCMDLSLVETEPVYVTALTWLKFDHCQFMTYDGSPKTSCQILPASGDATACQQMCPDDSECVGLNVVPFQNPSDVVFREHTNIPFDAPGCSRSELQQMVEDTPGVTVETAKVCYGFKPNPTPEVGTSHLVTEDPYDALFYSTCFRLETVTSLVGQDPPKISVYPWRWHHKCMDCDMAKRNAELSANIVPNWVWGDECRWCPDR